MTSLIAEGRLGGHHRQRLRRLVAASSSPIRVASPYVTDYQLLGGIRGRYVRLMTMLSPLDVVTGATSIDALDALIEAGVDCRAVFDGKLHAKVYIFGSERAVISSANLTESALDRNIEVGIEVERERVSELTIWYDRLWRNSTRRIDPAVLMQLRADTAALRQEYIALRQRSSLKSLKGMPSFATPHRSIDALVGSARRFFICNTNRRNPERTRGGQFLFESRMRSRGYAAAWTDFKYPAHMQLVAEGNAIFMFAKGVGIIGIGRATAGCETVQDGQAGRIYEQEADEWRVPVDWIGWLDEEAACPYRTPNHATFWDISGESYQSLRERVLSHFRHGL